MGLPDHNGLEVVTPVDPVDKEVYQSAPEVRYHRQSDSNKEVYVPPPSAYNHSTSPADQNPAFGPPGYYGFQTKPEYGDGTNQTVTSVPQSSNGNSAIGPREPPVSNEPREPRIFGMKKKVFWIVLVTALIAIIAVAVGAGVGVAMSNNDDDKTSSPSSSQSNSSANAEDNSGVSKDSKLASVSWTASGLTYARVYYQDTKGVINEAAWNSNAKGWKTQAITVPSNMLDSSGKPLDEGTEIDVKTNTPIAASVFNTEQDGFGISLFFLTSDNKIRELESKTPSGPWKPGSSDDLYSTSNNSQLTAVWVDQCKDCVHDTVLIFQVPNGKIQMWNRWKTGDLAIAMPDITPVDGSALAMAPVKADDAEKNAQLVMNVANSLTSLPFVPEGSPNGGWDKSFSGLQKLEDSTQLALMTYGTTTSDSSEYIQVFTTDPSNGGITSQRSLLDEQSWNSVDMPSSMKTVSGSSAIAANQAQMVFALRETTSTQDAGGAQLIQWQLTDGTDAAAEVVI